MIVTHNLLNMKFTTKIYFYLSNGVLSHVSCEASTNKNMLSNWQISQKLFTEQLSVNNVPTLQKQFFFTYIPEPKIRFRHGKFPPKKVPPGGDFPVKRVFAVKSLLRKDFWPYGLLSCFN